MAVIPFRRLIFRQYILGKAHKYKWNYIPLKSTPTVPGCKHSESVVLQLVQDPLNCVSTIYTDNFYSSFQLGEILLKKKTYIWRTLLKNRKGVPKEVTITLLKHGKVKSSENEKGKNLQ